MLLATKSIKKLVIQIEKEWISLAVNSRLVFLTNIKYRMRWWMLWLHVLCSSSFFFLLMSPLCLIIIKRFVGLLWRTNNHKRPINCGYIQNGNFESVLKADRDMLGKKVTLMNETPRDVFDTLCKRQSFSSFKLHRVFLLMITLIIKMKTWVQSFFLS